MNTKHVFSLLCIALVLFSFTIKPDTYTLDVGHTYLGFDIERFMVGEVSGRFNDFSGKLSMEGDDYSTLQMEAVIQVNSIDSNNETRDGHLKGQIWLDAATYPEIRFVSKKVTQDAEGKYMMTGNFTIKGVTKEVNFPIEILGPFKDPTQTTTVGVKGDFVIDRFDYNIALDKKMSNGSFFIGKDVKIKIRALAAKD